MDRYPRTIIQPTVTVGHIISLFYFEFGKDYVFAGEMHDFWEFLYVDKGEVDVMADSERHRLSQGSIIFHKPNEFHSIHANRVKAPNLIVMSFECDSEAMRQFENRIIALDDEERNLLAQIVKEGTNAFRFPSTVPLIRRDDAELGSEQLVKLYLEIFLVKLLRKTSRSCDNKPQSFAPREKQDDTTVRAMMAYMREKLDAKLSLADMSEALHVSKTRLKELFKRKTGFTVMEYRAKLRIDQAKTSIREQAHNMTEISQSLGFGSVHHFSKAFKKSTGMSPSEYAKSIKLKVEAKPGD